MSVYVYVSVSVSVSVSVCDISIWKKHSAEDRSRRRKNVCL